MTAPSARSPYQRVAPCSGRAGFAETAAARPILPRPYLTGKSSADLMSTALPNRSRLPHDVPHWVDPAWRVWFVTICTHPRGSNQLASPQVWRVISESIVHRREQGVWFTQILLLMPDHLHMLMRLPPESKTLKRLISDWKRWISRECSIRWQRDFFDHRLRSDESWAEKGSVYRAEPGATGAGKGRRGVAVRLAHGRRK